MKCNVQKPKNKGIITFVHERFSICNNIVRAMKWVLFDQFFIYANNWIKLQFQLVKTAQFDFHNKTKV